MILSPNKIIGMLVYRTREALNQNDEFMRRLREEYRYHPNCLVDGHFNLWHYVGTPTEISGAILKRDSLVKFPSILDFKPNTEDYIFNGAQFVRISYQLAIAGSSLTEWSSEEREAYVFEPLLRPIYEEFIRQIRNCGTLFQLNYGIPPHRKIEVYTTGDNTQSYVERYGETIDALEIHNFSLDVKVTQCEKIGLKIDRENSAVTEHIEKILNCK